MPFDGQREKRRDEEFRDQHGRIYWANIELKTGDPTDAPHAVEWDAPTNPDWAKGLLMPPTDDREIVRMVPRKERARRGYQLQIDYVRWREKWDEAFARLQKKIADYAKGMTKGSGSMLQMIEDPPAELLRIVGRGPLNTPRVFIEAAAAGNPWALGQTEKIPAKAQAILDELRPFFTGKTKGLIVGYDPLKGDDDEDGPSDVVLDRIIDPFGDIEENHDHDAVGTQQGKPVPVRAKKKPKQNPTPATAGV